MFLVLRRHTVTSKDASSSPIQNKAVPLREIFLLASVKRGKLAQELP
jgi:hypothetical protein